QLRPHRGLTRHRPIDRGGGARRFRRAAARRPRLPVLVCLVDRRQGAGPDLEHRLRHHLLEHRPERGLGMPVIEVRPFIMRNAIIEFDTDDFAKAVSTATLTPSSGTAEFKGLKPDAVFTFPQATTWTLELTFAQDWSAATSLSRYLFDHAGETIAFTLNPDDTTADATLGSTTWSGTVAIAPGAIGGDVDAVATATVSLGIVGAPVPTYTAGTP